MSLNVTESIISIVSHDGLPSFSREGVIFFPEAAKPKIPKRAPHEREQPEVPSIIPDKKPIELPVETPKLPVTIPSPVTVPVDPRVPVPAGR